MSNDLENLLFKTISRNNIPRHLKIEKLLDAWYCLHNENVTVIVDKTRPRVFRIYTHGKFGDFQNLLYDTNFWRELTGSYGIVPSYKIDGEEVMPFISSARWFEDFGNGKAKFDEISNSVNLENLDCYVVYGAGNLNASLIKNKYTQKENRRPPINFKVRLSDDELILNVTYPAGIEQGMLSINLYPLYTHYVNDKRETHQVEYFQHGFEKVVFPHFDEIIGKSITLKDYLCRLPQLVISSLSGKCRLISQTDKERNNAFRLNVIIETSESEEEVRIKFQRNPITVKVEPLVRADRESQIEIAGGKVAWCKIDEKAHKIRSIRER